MQYFVLQRLAQTDEIKELIHIGHKLITLISCLLIKRDP